MGLGAVALYSGPSAPASRLASVVAQAFASYEPWVWSFGDYAGAPRSSWLLDRQIGSMLEQRPAVAHAVPVKCDGDEAGFAAVGFLVRCTDASAPPSPSLAEKLTLLWTLGPRCALKLNEFNHAVHELHAADAADVGEHFMVSLVGVLPHMQGRGLARQLMESMLATADRENMPVYLFTGNDRNEAMYTRFGFTTRSRRSMGPIVAGHGSGTEVVVRSMLRPAVSGI